MCIKLCNQDNTRASAKRASTSELWTFKQISRCGFKICTHALCAPSPAVAYPYLKSWICHQFMCIKLCNHDNTRASAKRASTSELWTLLNSNWWVGLWLSTQLSATCIAQRHKLLTAIKNRGMFALSPVKCNTLMPKGLMARYYDTVDSGL